MPFHAALCLVTALALAAESAAAAELDAAAAEFAIAQLRCLGRPNPTPFLRHLAETHRIAADARTVEDSTSCWTLAPLMSVAGLPWRASVPLRTRH